MSKANEIKKYELQNDGEMYDYTGDIIAYCKFDEVESVIKELEQQKVELMEAFTELLQDAMYLYQYDPNNFRKTQNEYFKIELDLLKKYSGE